MMEKENVCLYRVHCCPAIGKETPSEAKGVGQGDNMSSEVHQTQKDTHFVTGKFKKLEQKTECWLLDTGKGIG